jgi:hypothetical protein
VKLVSEPFNLTVSWPSTVTPFAVHPENVALTLTSYVQVVDVGQFAVALPMTVAEPPEAHATVALTLVVPLVVVLTC